MKLFQEIITCLLCLVVYVALRRFTFRSRRNGFVALLAYLSKSYINFFTPFSASPCLSFKSLNARIPGLLQHTPDFFPKKSNSAKFFCKSSNFGTLYQPAHSGGFVRQSVFKGGIVTVVLLFVFTGGVNAATYYSVVTNGNWNTAATWSLTSGGAGGAGVPVAGDNVFIDGGHNVIVIANAACTTVSFTTATATSLNINAGITLNVSGAITIPRSGAGVNTLAVGAGILNAGSIAFTNGGGGVRHLMTISTGTVTVTGNVTQTGSTGSASITFTGAGLLKLGGSFLTAATGTLTQGAGTVEYNAGGAQTVGNFTYNNLLFSGSGAKSIVTGTAASGNLSISGTALASVGAGLNISAGTLTLGGAGVINGTWGSTSSSATYKNNTYFAATTGIITVSSSSCTSPTITGTLSVCKGFTTQLTGSGTAAASNPWVSATTTVATVNSTGLVTGVSTGTSVITYTTNNGCSTTVTVTVNSSPLITVQPVDQAKCQGSSVTFSVTATGTPAPTYQWRRQLTDIPGATSSTYTIPSVASTDADWYNVLVSNACLPDIISNNFQLTVDPSSIAGTTSADQIICSGNSPSNITLTGNTGTIQWQLSADNVTFNNITGATSSPLTSAQLGALVATRYYRAIVTSGVCSSVNSATVTVLVNPTPAISAITTSICSGGTFTVTPVNITNGVVPAGTTYTWSAPTVTGGMSGGAASSGSPTSITGTLTNPTLIAQTATYNVTPTSGTCTGVPFTVTVTVNPAVGNPTPITISAGTEPTCQLTNATTTTSYTTTATNSTGFNWSISNGAAGTINPTTGVMTWANGFTGTADIQVTANGCFGPSTQVTRTVTVNPSVGTPTSITVSAGTEPTCQFTGTTTTYSTSATNNSGFNWSLSNGAAGSINPTTGVMTWAPAFSGTVDIRVTANGCNGPSAQISRTVTVTPLPAATINYAGSPFCKSVASVAVTRTGTVGGVYTASPAGLTMDAAGTIYPGGSAAGTYTVTYTIAAAGGCGVVTATAPVTITALPVATFSYIGSPYCSNDANSSPTFSGGAAAGTFSSTAGLVFVSTATGQISLATSTPGTYTITNTIPAAGGCSLVTATSSITITKMPVATFNYGGTPYCSNATDPTPTYSGGGVAGAFTSSPVGLVFLNTATGLVDLSGSIPGTYTVTNTIIAAGGCAQVVATSPITITAVPIAAFNYVGDPFCSNEANPLPTMAPGGVNGTFSASPAGLNFVSTTTGEVNFLTSTPGTYTITNTIAVAGGCGAVTASDPITITKAPDATFSYAGSPFCSNAANPSPIFPVGASAGTFSSVPAGITFVNPATGVINISVSIPGTYTIINTVPAMGGCGAVTATYPITINTRPTITADYCGPTAPKIRLTATGGGTYQWLAPLSGNSSFIDVDIVGSYGVQVTNGSCVETVYLTTSAELVTNGDFTAGKTGFTSDYTYYADVAGNSELVPDNGTNGYGVGTDGQNYHNNFWGQDHTNNAIGTRNFMLVNGHGTLIAWREVNIPVVAGTTYYFSAWAISLNNAGPFANLQFNINGSTSGMSQTSTGVLPGRPENNSIAPWTRFYGNWTAPSTGNVTLSIVDLETAAGGNDFGLDDISFGTLDPAPATLISPVGTDGQTVCINTPIANIKYSTAKTTGATITGLPTGVSYSMAGNVVTISGTPTVAGSFNYTVTLTGCGPNIIKTGSITVTQNVSAGTVSGTSPLCVGAPFTYTKTGTAGGTWSSSNTLVASVNAASGLVIALSAGTSDIIYTVNSGCGSPVSAFKTLTVTPSASIASVTGASPLCINGTATYTANAAVLGGGTGTWSSSNPAIATVNAAGLVTGKSAGTCDIIYTIAGGCGGNKTAQQSVTINSNAIITTITGTSPLCINATATYTATAVLGGGIGTWSSDNTAIATVNATTGLVTGVAIGTCNIIYTITGGCGGTVSKPQPITISPNASIGSVTGSSPLCITGTTTFTANAVVLSGGAGTWSSSAPTIATVNSSTGFVTGVSAGSCDIIYTISGGCGGPIFVQQPITITPNASIASVTGASPLCMGASATYLANTVVLGGAGGSGAWSSSNTLVATVDASGLVTGVSAGTSNIIYTITGGCGGTVSKQQSVTIQAIPTATISGTTSVCLNAIAPTITFTNPRSTAETVTYNINSGANLAINIAANSTATVTVPTTTAGTFAYNLGSVVYQTGLACSNSISGTEIVTVASPLIAGAHNTTPLTECVGYNPASLSFNVTPITGGKTPYAYQWRINGTPVLGETNATFFNPPALILAGTYSYDCVVTDGCSSFTTSPKVITIVPDPSVGISGNASVCLNTSTTLTANITDGTGLYAYQWRSGTTATGPWTDISGEINSTYNPPTTSVGTFYFQVFVHPNHPECNQTTSATHTLVVNAPPVAATASTTVQPTCAVATGTIVVTAPLGAYQYNIDGGAWQASVTFAGVAAGSHNILVRSTVDNTCVSAPTAVTVNAQPLPPAAPTASTTVQPTCALATGTIVVTAPVGAYQYNIDGGAWQASVTFAGVTAGSHNILVRSTADNTCVSAPTAVTVNAQPSPPAALTASTTVQPTCALATGTIVVTAPVGAYQYNIDGGAWQASVTFAGVAAGSHNILVRSTADNTCVSAPTAVTVNAVPPVPSCNITGTSSVFSGSSDTYTSTPVPADNVTHSWSISGNGTITSVTTNATVDVTAGSAGTFTLTDNIIRFGCTSSCTFDVTVISPCSISPISGSVTNGTTTTYSAPAGMDTYSWTITGNGSIPSGIANQQAVAVLAGNLCTSYTLSLSMTKNGVTSTCSQTVTVTDNQAPTFTLPTTELSYCVNNIISAVYNPTPTPLIIPEYDDITTPRPEYYLLTSTGKFLDLDPIINSFDDNCCADNSLKIHWRIVFAPTPNPATVAHELITKPAITGQTGQPSAYGDILFPGDGVTFTDVVHRIYYWLEDCNGNPKGIPNEQFVNITIKPRPNIMKVP